jgi:two-component system chemotaxis response regulator CheY
MSHESLQIDEMYILLVEASPTQAKLIAQQCQQLQVHILKMAHCGEDALRLMREDQPDLVISSMYLTDMSGTDLIISMRNDERLAEVPFMLISSETSFKLLDPIRQAGAVAILPKPFTAKDLERALATSLDHINIHLHQEAFDEIDMADVKVLMVDDSRMARNQMRRVLTSLGIEIIDEAINGKEAIPLLEATFYDLVLTDYNMPEMDGQELIHYIRTQSSQTSIPILMVTSESNQNRIAAIQQAGVSGICDKPFEATSVKEYLQRMLTDQD